ncbi:MAG: serine hydrolase [Bacteroidota bacterium]
MNLPRFVISLIICFTLSSCHVGRFFIWNFADTNDKNKFASVPLKAPEKTFQFTAVSSEENPLSLPENMKVDGESFAFEQALAESKTVAFLVIRNDSLLYERYLDDYTPQTIHTSFSVAKSFVSALVGIAIDEGYITSVQEPISTYLPDLHPELIDTITIEDLLDMRSGITFNEGYFNPFGHVAKFYYGTNLRKFITQLKSGQAPDQEFDYISSNPQMLGIILENATGKPLYEYMQEKIWTPLEMETDASWSVDNKRDKMVKAFCCLNATARDFAKFGRLYLNNGNWNGKQIVSEKWVAQSTTFDRVKNGFQYSYQWWHTPYYQAKTDTMKQPDLYDTGSYTTRDTTTNEKVKQTYVVSPTSPFLAEGILGQFIYINPDKNLIIVRLGKKYGKTSWKRNFRNIAKMN